MIEKIIEFFKSLFKRKVVEEPIEIFLGYTHIEEEKELYILINNYRTRMDSFYKKQ